MPCETALHYSTRRLECNTTPWRSMRRLPSEMTQNCLMSCLSGHPPLAPPMPSAGDAVGGHSDNAAVGSRRQSSLRAETAGLRYAAGDVAAASQVITRWCTRLVRPGRLAHLERTRRRAYSFQLVTRAGPIGSG